MMIDTLIVLWTSGTWKRFLRATGQFLLLFASICALLLLIVTGDASRAGLAVTVASAGKAGAPLAIQAVPAPTTMPTALPYIVPVILQNPLVASPTAVPHVAPYTEPHGKQIYQQRPTYRRTPHPAAPTAQPAPAPTASSNTGLPDPSNILSTFP